MGNSPNPPVPVIPPPATAAPPDVPQVERFADIFRNSMTAAGGSPPPALDAEPEPGGPTNEAPPEVVETEQPIPPEGVDLASLDFDAEPGAPPAEPPSPGEEPVQPAQATPEEGVEAAAPLAELRALLESGAQLPPELEKLLLHSTRGKRIYSAFKALSSLEKPPEQGGLGFIPPIEDLKSWYAQSNAFQALNHDFDNNTESFQANFFAPDPETQQLRPGVGPFLDTFLPNLYRHNPPAFHRAVGPYIMSMLNAMSAEAAGIPEDHNKDAFGVDERKRYQDAIAIMRSKFIPNSPHALKLGGQGSAPAAAPAQPPDALSERERAIAAREAALNRQAAGLVQSQVEQTDVSISNAILADIRSDIDKLCATAHITPDKFNSPWMMQEWRRQFENAVTLAVTGDSNKGIPSFSPEGFRNFQVLLEQARAAARVRPLGQTWSLEADPSATRAKTVYRQIARAVIRAIGPQFVKDAQGTILAGMPRPSESVAAAQTQREPQAGAPVQHSVVAAPVNGQKLEIKPGENLTEAIARRFAASMTANASPRRPGINIT